MPVPPSFGVLVAPGSAGGGASFVGVTGESHFSPNPTHPVAYPVGTAAGDYVFVFGQNNSGSMSISTAGWTSFDPPDFGGTIHRKKIVGGDLAATLNVISSNNSVMVAVFRGVNASTNPASSTNGSYSGSATVTLTGFVKSVGCKGIVILCGKSTSASAYALTSGLTATTMTPNPLTTDGAGAFGGFYTLTPGADYVNSTNIVVNIGAAHWDQQATYAFDMT